MAYILIIGADSDIAKAVARKYTENGYDLYLAARKPTRLKAFAKDLIIRTEQNINIVELDILNYDAHNQFYEDLEEKPLGVISAVGYLAEQTQAQDNFSVTQKIIESNYTGIVSLLNIIANDFEQRQSGFIVAISSVAGDRGRKSNYIYGSAKAALTVYLSGLRNRLYSSNVQVLTVKPGFVQTKMTAAMVLPPRLTAQVEDVAEDIYQAQQQRKDILYTKSVWRWLMLIIINIPEFLFKKISL